MAEAAPKMSGAFIAASPYGTHKTKKEVREGMLKFALSEQGKAMLAGMGIKITSKEGAEKYVDTQMASLSAWKKK